MDIQSVNAYIVTPKTKTSNDKQDEARQDLTSRCEFTAFPIVRDSRGRTNFPSALK